MEQIPLDKRPPYFISSDYRPEWKGGFANWNKHTHSVPDLRTWLFDKIQYHATTELRDPSLKEDILATIMTATLYDKTSIELSPVNTVVTHMYVCELLNKVLLLFFGVKPIPHHWYSVKNPQETNILSIYCHSRDWIAKQMHNLFYDTPLPLKLENLSEYLKFCPELIKETYSILQTIPNVFEWMSEGYWYCWDHKKAWNYHCCSTDALIPWDPTALLPVDEWFFPEIWISYTVNNNMFTHFSVEDTPKTDDFISTTADINGTKYLMWFWNSYVPKQRDIEIRFYIIYLLWTIARYSPLLWSRLEKNEPWTYLMIKRFIETNHIIYPFLILRYITWRWYSFWKTSRWED